MPTYARMTRSRLYILIDAFESDLRNMLLRYVLDHLDEEAALGPNYKAASLRRDNDAITGETQSTIFYLDLREAYDILNRHREVLPAELGRELKTCTPDMDRLVPIRNRVMHGRPLNAGDAENALSVCSAFTTRYWTTTREAIEQLKVDPLWEPPLQRQMAPSERVLHNLPLPEYDETGLIGRDTTKQELKDRLMRRREPIITITGEGGIGKTATALEVAYMIIDDPDCPYECVLWASLKTERLTADGIESIVDSISDMQGLARNLGTAFDDAFLGGVHDLAEALQGLETLLIIDNLETVHGNEIVDLYDILPDTITYLFTSRVGIGQLERRVPLSPLNPKDASKLFRSFARSRGIDRLSTLTSQTISEVVAKLRNSPLAIRWFILSVEAGKQPLAALSDQDYLLDFCVKSVYEAMTSDSKHVLAVLFAVDRSVTFDEIAILAEISADDLTNAVRQLTTGSLVRLERDKEAALISRLCLTEAAQSYLRRVNPPKKTVVDKVLDLEQDFRKSAERRRTEERERRLAPNVVRIRTSTDEPVAHVLRRALKISKDGDQEAALQEVVTARSLNPEYWEVDRVEGFILSAYGQVDAATSSYQSALRKADEQGRAVTAYYLAGHLARKAHQPDRAIQYARVAHEHFNMPETGQALGSYLIWIKEFVEGQRFLEDALEQAEGRIRLIALTALVDSSRRWAEHLLDHERNISEAAQKALAGFSVGYSELESGIHDNRLAAAVIESFNMYVRCITVTGFDPSPFHRQSLYLIRKVSDRAHHFKMCRGAEYLPAYLKKLARASAGTEVADQCAALLQNIEAFAPEAPPQEIGEQVQNGEIVRWLGTYGFIGNPVYSKGIFFPAVALEGLSGRGEELDLQGRMVSFIPKRDQAGRLRADWVKLIEIK